MKVKPKEDKTSITFPCIRVQQPIGEFFVGSISSSDLCRISWVDVRRIEGEERQVEKWLGIQRPLNKSRVKELVTYVNTQDACFPTGVILAIEGRCVTYDEKKGTMTLSNNPEPEEGEEPVLLGEIAKVLDGQHRIAGLLEFHGKTFDVNVSVFVDIDIADQAYIFSTVNLAQTKVNRSLVYDLYELAESRSPQKTCHNIAVALDRHEKSPFFKRIKRLGVATAGRFNETLTQATVVQSLLGYISTNPMVDRDTYLRGHKPTLATANELNKLIFRNMFIEEKDLQITDVVWNFFEAVETRWTEAWNNFGLGNVLNKTNGFRALFRFLRPTYLYLTAPGGVPSKEQFLKVLNRIKLSNQDFTTDVYKPGGSGETKLYGVLVEQSGVEVVEKIK